MTAPFTPRAARLLRAFGSLGRQTEMVFGINRRNVELVYAHNPRAHYPFADDKALCKRRMAQHGVPVPHTLADCRGLFEVDAAVAKLVGRGEFVVKPARGSGGEGVLVVGARRQGGWDTPGGVLVSEGDLRLHLANVVFGAFSRQLEDCAVIEERVSPHEFYASLWPDGVCDLRVLVLEGRPLLAMLRVPTRRSRGRANLHQGGLGVAIDLRTGRTARAMSRGVSLMHHPETGAPLIDRELPDFARCLQVAVQAAQSVPLGYLGVDLVVDAVRGPLVLELNVRPGLEIQNVTGTPLGAAIALPSGGAQ